MKSLGIVTALIVLVLVLWGGSYFFINTLNLSIAERGQFGDTFGAVNSLFTGLAFAGLIATIFLQRDELALQREELALQRQEMVLSRGELANQAKVQHAQYIAALGQIRVSAYEARIESVKTASETVSGGYRQQYADQIAVMADGINEIAKDVERLVKEDTKTV